ncbi:Uncharacterised protein [Mycobacteroides abscessus subsp. abscessus]|nr:Uncharacterised protein [Mycobacteroides abscessus subsp. abscessus]
MRARSALADTATAVTAASEPAMPAYAPKWWVHFVGLNIMKKIVPNTMPINRQVGALAMPGTRLRRSNTSMVVNRHSSITRKANRRESDPSTVSTNR